MNVLTAVRQEAAEQLEAQGISASHFVPERLNPPMVVVVPGEPYVEAGEAKTFDDVQVRLTFSCVVDTATNEVQAEGLEDVAIEAIDALSNWDLESVSAPYALTSNNAVYLACDVVMTASINLKEVIK